MICMGDRGTSIISVAKGVDSKDVCTEKPSACTDSLLRKFSEK